MVKTVINLSALSLLILIAACNSQQQETPHTQEPQQEQTNAEDAQTPNEEQTDAREDVSSENNPLIEGTWKGTLGGGSAVLQITEQYHLDFSGTFEAEALGGGVHPILGAAAVEENIFFMQYGEEQPVQGKFNGKFSNEDQTITGTFSPEDGGKKHSFTLNYAGKP